MNENPKELIKRARKAISELKEASGIREEDCDSRRRKMAEIHYWRVPKKCRNCPNEQIVDCFSQKYGHDRIPKESLERAWNKEPLGDQLSIPDAETKDIGGD